MSGIESLTDPEEQAAAEFCRKALETRPGASYKELRREGHAQGIKVTRRIYSAVCRSLYGSDEWGRGEQAAPAPPDSGEEPRADGHQGNSPEDAAGAAPPQEEEESTTPGGGWGSEQGAASPREDPQSTARRQWDEFFKKEEAPPAGAPGGGEPAPPGGSDEPSSGTRSAMEALGFFSGKSGTVQRTAVEFMADYLRDKPEAGYKEVREAAENNGYTVSSATFGRAQAMVGLVEPDEPPVLHREEGERAARRRRRSGDAAELLEEFIERLAEVDRKRSRYREAIKSMLDVVRKALAATSHRPGPDDHGGGRDARGEGPEET